MKVIGSLGSVSGLLLRTGQCLLGITLIAVMLLTPGFHGIFAYTILFILMVVHVVWSLLHLCSDAFFLLRRRDQNNPGIIITFAIVDLVMAFLLLFATSSSIGVTIFIINDLKSCKYTYHPCSTYQFSAILASLTLLLSTISSIGMLGALKHAND